MNTVIERTARLPFAVIDQVQVSLIQTIILYISIGYFAWWLLEKKRFALVTGTGFLAIFFLLRTSRLIQQSAQQKLIVYNIPKQKAIDVIDGNSCRFLGNVSAIEAMFSFTAITQSFMAFSRVNLRRTFVSDQMIAGEHRSVLVIDKPIKLGTCSSENPG
jgi:hypothetical protein